MCVRGWGGGGKGYSSMLLAALTSAVPAAAPPGYTLPPQPACALTELVGHNWSYISPQAFRGGSWSPEEKCVYSFGPSAEPSSQFSFHPPPECLPHVGTLGWPGDVAPPFNLAGPALGNLSGGTDITLRFATHLDGPLTACARCQHSPSSCCSCPAASTPCTRDRTKCCSTAERRLTTTEVGGWMAADCSLIDMTDGGMYVRGHPGRSHPMDFAPHEYLALATAWVLRSAIVTFPFDGSRHLTPGIPIAPGAKPHYFGYWMRDGILSNPLCLCTLPSA